MMMQFIGPAPASSAEALATDLDCLGANQRDDPVTNAASAFQLRMCKPMSM